MFLSFLFQVNDRRLYKKGVTVIIKKEEKGFADPLQITRMTFVEHICADEVKKGRLRANANHCSFSKLMDRLLPSPTVLCI